MAKGAEAFRSIGEVAKLIGVAPHVLRYWETQFSLLKPMKRGDGRRYYRPDDVRLAAGICEILRDEGLTIRGAKKMLAKDRGETVRRRGAIKLGEAPETGDPIAAEAPAKPAPLLTETAQSAPDSGDLAQMDEPDREPRARSRKRPATRTPEPLPLFPEDRQAAAQITPEPQPAAASPVDAGQAGWLLQLTRLNLAMRAHPADAPLPDPARATALRLLDAIADHF